MRQIYDSILKAILATGFVLGVFFMLSFFWANPSSIVNFRMLGMGILNLMMILVSINILIFFHTLGLTNGAQKIIAVVGILGVCMVTLNSSFNYVKDFKVYFESGPRVISGKIGEVRDVARVPVSHVYLEGSDIMLKAFLWPAPKVDGVYTIYYLPNSQHILAAHPTE